MSRDWHMYDGSVSIGVDEKAAQIRHLAAIGVAASDTAYNIRNFSTCYISLFEVIARLAHEIEDEVDP
ncbi:hypothetical protein H4P12_00170 [Paracoccus sp. 11-3]|uniref:Uncharacterized protein n=1 Tax=Paracoccus amoyensis TaxID=2760093 RepID=A0A926GB60_9RHOB|nr:hypothetical protein [Paracoccus amoyensis]MBC9245161.1 hypothetical protein [Paracoccus amoyensis]